MDLALLVKVALVLLGAYLIFGGIVRRRRGIPRRDPAVDRLLLALGLAAGVLIVSITLGGLARVYHWPAWIGSVLDVLAILAALVAFVCGPILGWKLVGEQHRNPPT